MPDHSEARLRESVLLTLRPDIVAKKEGEKQLEHLSTSSEFLGSLLRISAGDSDAMVRSVSAIYFRRYLERFWKLKSFGQEKARLISHFPTVLYTCSAEGEVHLLAALYFILEYEETDLWEPILRSANECLVSHEEKKIWVGLKMANAMAKALSKGYKSESVAETFFNHPGPLILGILSSALSSRMYGMAAYAMKILVHGSEHYKLPQFYLQEQNARSILSLCLASLDLVHDSEKLLKWGLVLCNNLLKKTRRKKQGKNVQISALVHSPDVLKPLYQKAAAILEFGAGSLAVDLESSRFGMKIVLQAFALLSNIVESDNGWALVRGDAPRLISALIIPAVRFSDEDKEMWEDSQVEFVKFKEARYAETLQSSAGSLFYDMIKKSSGDPQQLTACLSVLVSAMAVYNTHPTEESSRVRYGGLYLLANTARYLKKDTSLFSSIILPDLASRHAHVRYMAFAAIQYFSGFAPLPPAVLEPFFAAISGNDVAVVVQAMLSLPYILEVGEMKEKLKGHIPQLIQLLLTLSNQVQIEPLSSAIEEVVNTCIDESLAIAPSIASAISASILGLVAQEASSDEEVDDRYEVVNGYMRTISLLLDSLQKSPETVRAILHICKEMIMTIIKVCPDMLYELFPVIISGTYALQSVDGLLDVLQALLALERDDILSCSNELAVTLDNFISYGGNAIVPYTADIFRVLEVMSPADEFTDMDHIASCRILESLILHLTVPIKESMPGFLHSAIALALRSREEMESHATIAASAEVAMCAFIISPVETLQILRDLDLAQYISSTLASNYRRFERVHDKKILLLFSGILLSSPAQSIPPEFSPDAVGALFHFAVTTLPQAIAHRESLKDGGDDDLGDHYGYGDEDFFDEDPSLETPLDRIEPFGYARGVCSSQQGTFFLAAWSTLSSLMKDQVTSTISSHLASA